MPKTYFLKYNSATGEILLDSSREKFDIHELLIKPYRITQAQARKLNERLQKKYIAKNKKPFFNEVEYECAVIFHSCENCGYVTDKAKVNKPQGKLCRKCFKKYQEQQKVEFRAQADYRRQVRKYKLHLATLQGKADAVPMEIIERNIRLQLQIRGKTLTSLSRHFNLSVAAFTKIFANKTVSHKILLDICEYIGTPLEKILQIPKGIKIPYKDGVPLFWLDTNFRIRHYDDNIPKHC